MLSGKIMEELFSNGLYYEVKTGSPDPHNRGELKECMLFAGEELQELAVAVSVIEKLFNNIVRSFSAEEACNEFLRELRGLNSTNTLNVARVDRRFRNYLTEFRLFLDHWDKFISDLKKKDKIYGSTYEKLNKDARSEVYDSCDEYVLAYVLRNYVSHVYDAVERCHVDGFHNKACITKESLLKFKMAPSARQVIERQPDLINLEKVATVSLSGLQKVQDKLIDYQMTDNVAQAALTLLKAKKRIDDAKITSDVWLLVSEAKPIIVPDYKNGIKIQRCKDDKRKSVYEQPIVLPKLEQGIELGYHFIDWDYCVNIAAYLKRLWEQGYWKDIQKKYGLPK